MSKGKDSTVRALKKFYRFIFLVLLLDRIDTVPTGLFSLLRKLKFVYIVLVMLYLVSDIRINRKTLSTVMTLIVIVFHSVTFGLVIVNRSVLYETHLHFRELMLLLAFIVGTVHLYRKEGFVQEFARHTFLDYLISLIWAGLTHISSFVNPVKFVYVLGGAHAFRVTFGMGHANYVGSICCCALICSIYIIEDKRRHGSFNQLLHKKNVWKLIIADIYIGEMLFSTASRTAIIAFACAMAIYLVVFSGELFPNLGVKNAKYIFIAIGCLIGVVLLTQGVFHELAETSHRDNLMDTNMEILLTYFSIWTGMGYINYSGYRFGVWKLGYQTYNLDSYYGYIFFSTGIIGIIMIITALIITTLGVLKASYKRKNVCGVITLISFLLIGAAQASIISYDHLISYTYWILLILVMVDADNGKIVNRRRRIATFE